MRILDATGWLALAAAVTAATVVVLPLEPDFLYPDLDVSFGATLHWAEAHRGEPAVRLIHTYGPLGFAHYSSFQPETFRSLVALRFAFAAALCWPLAWLGWTAAASPWGAALAVAGSAPLLGVADLRGVLLPLLALLVWLPARRPPPALQVALGAGLALVALTKTTFLVLAVVALLPAVWAAVATPRRVPWMLIGALVTAVSIWAAWGMGPRDAVEFLDWSLREITPGYAQGEQRPATPALVVHAIAVSVALLLAAALLARRAGGGRRALLATLAGLLFLIFKVGFVRADVHVFITVGALFVAAVLLGVLWGGAQPLRVVAAVAVLAVLPATLFWHALTGRIPPSGPYRIATASEIWHRLRTVPALLDPSPFAAMNAASVAAIRAGQPLPPLDGPVDVYTYFQARVLANGLAFRPRPVFQSYLAFTARLARANADFLEGEWAPRWVLFQPGTLDNRLPSLDDAPSWPLLLSRYELMSTQDAMVLLGRRAQPLPWRNVPLTAVETATDTPIDVPSAGLIWARIDVHESLADRLVTVALSAPSVWIVASFADGHQQRFRLIPSVARDGFLLSPVVASAEAFAALMPPGAPPPANRVVTTIRVEMASPLGGQWGAHEVTVELASLQFDADAGDPPAALAPRPGS